MNHHSCDDIREFLKYLPANDVCKFKRLNKKFATTIIENPTTFTGKPTISMVIGGYPEDKKTRNNGTITIQAAKGAFRFSVLYNFEIKPVEQSQNFKEFMDPFYKHGESRPVHERNHIIHFLEWVFRRADLAILDVNKMRRLAFWVKQAIADTSCKCYVLAVSDGFSLLDVFNVKAEKFCKEFGEQQRALEVPLVLRLESDEVLLEFIRASLNINYGQYFTEVITDFRGPRFFKTLVDIKEVYMENPDAVANIRIRFDYGNLKPAGVRLNFIHGIINTRFQLLCPSMEECQKISKFPWLEFMPESLDIHDDSNGNTLRFAFEIDGRSLLLTTEINPWR